MLEQAIAELTKAVNANTAAILGSVKAAKTEKPAKSEDDEDAKPAKASAKAEKPAKSAKTEDDEDAKPVKKSAKAPTKEDLLGAFKAFLAFEAVDEGEKGYDSFKAKYDERMEKVKAYAKKNGAAKPSEIEESLWPDAITWANKQLEGAKAEAFDGDDEKEDSL